MPGQPGFEELTVEGPAITVNPPYGSSVSVSINPFDLDNFAEYHITRELFRPRAEGLFFLGTIDPVQPDFLLNIPRQQEFDRITIADPDDLTRAAIGKRVLTHRKHAQNKHCKQVPETGR